MCTAARSLCDEDFGGLDDGGYTIALLEPETLNRRSGNGGGNGSGIDFNLNLAQNVAGSDARYSPPNLIARTNFHEEYLLPSRSRVQRARPVVEPGPRRANFRDRRGFWGSMRSAHLMISRC